MSQYQDRIKYMVVGALMFLSFLVAYYSFRNVYFPATTSAETDRLSGEEYAPVESEDNPYAPYFVGFDRLVDRGVSRDELRYINDVITNYTLYTKKAYKAKVSYVKDSFERDYTKSLSTTYRFKFGINDTDIHTVSVSANTFDETISLKIISKGNNVKFSKKFTITLSGDSN